MVLSLSSIWKQQVRSFHPQQIPPSCPIHPLPLRPFWKPYTLSTTKKHQILKINKPNVDHIWWDLTQNNIRSPVSVCGDIRQPPHHTVFANVRRSLNFVRCWTKRGPIDISTNKKKQRRETNMKKKPTKMYIYYTIYIETYDADRDQRNTLLL